MQTETNESSFRGETRNKIPATEQTLRTPGTGKHAHAPVGVVTTLHAKFLLAPMKSVTLGRPLPSFSIEIVTGRRES